MVFYTHKINIVYLVINFLIFPGHLAYKHTIKIYKNRLRHNDIQKGKSAALDTVTYLSMPLKICLSIQNTIVNYQSHVEYLDFQHLFCFLMHYSNAVKLSILKYYNNYVLVCQLVFVHRGQTTPDWSVAVLASKELTLEASLPCCK